MLSTSPPGPGDCLLIHGDQKLLFWHGSLGVELGVGVDRVGGADAPVVAEKNNAIIFLDESFTFDKNTQIFSC